jgi:hypothetical protein
MVHIHSILEEERRRPCLDQEATVCMARRAAKMWMFILLYSISKLMLKVLTNEKRGGLKVVEFDRSPFKLFTLKFSNKSVQSSSCERQKTAQQIMILLFSNNNCYPIML